jgi:sugar-specific transcriptional regulator TrmB
MSLGLSRKEAEIYVYLATNGPREAENIAENLRLNRQQVSSSLKSLQKRKIVISTLDHSTQFSALSFRKTMTLLVKAKKEGAQHIEQNKEELLSEWHSMVRGNSAK